MQPGFSSKILNCILRRAHIRGTLAFEAFQKQTIMKLEIISLHDSCNYKRAQQGHKTWFRANNFKASSIRNFDVSCCGFCSVRSVLFFCVAQKAGPVRSVRNYKGVTYATQWHSLKAARHSYLSPICAFQKPWTDEAESKGIEVFMKVCFQLELYLL